MTICQLSFQEQLGSALWWKSSGSFKEEEKFFWFCTRLSLSGKDIECYRLVLSQQLSKEEEEGAEKCFYTPHCLQFVTPENKETKIAQNK